MQVLFQSSAESPSSTGLGLIPSPIERFDDAPKSVPHMGWNTASPLDPSPADVDAAAHYYFVHSYRAAYDPARWPEAAQWAHTLTQYGQELFVSSVRKGRVFGTQFHPEKSGAAGLALLDAWLRAPDVQMDASIAPRVPRAPAEKDGLTRRIVACMDVRANDEGDLVVTKGDQYDVREKAAPSHSPTPNGDTLPASSPSSTLALAARTAGAVRNLGKPIALAAAYACAGADELCLLNITSFRRSPLHDQPMLALVRAAAQHVFVPLTIGGGVQAGADPDGTPRSALDVAAAYFRAGADKVSVGSDAVRAVERLRERGGEGDGSSGIEQIARAYGRQAVVVSVDPRRAFVDPAAYDGPRKDELVYGVPEGPEDERGKAWWYQCTVSGGREARDLSVVELARGAERLGAGEILLNSIDRDGTGRGFDIELVRLVKNAVRIPVVASSGAGSVGHFVDVFEKTGVEAALAAGIFHRGEVKIEEVKQALKQAGINARD